MSARRLQRTFRRHKIANMVWRQQHALWMMFYDHYDALLHSGERAKYRGVFDLGEFSILLESAYGGPVATELIMLVFNEWHDRADMLMDKADHSVQICSGNHGMHLQTRPTNLHWDSPSNACSNLQWLPRWQPRL